MKSNVQHKLPHIQHTQREIKHSTNYCTSDTDNVKIFNTAKTTADPKHIMSTTTDPMRTMLDKPNIAHTSPNVNYLTNAKGIGADAQSS